MATFRFQKNLPRLVVPDLSETASTYLGSVKPHLSPAEFSRTQKAVAQFVEPNGFGHVLQQRLKERDAQMAAQGKSWLIDWWNDYAYMGYRDPVPINVNYFFVFKDDKLRTAPVSRAAAIVQGVLQFKDLLINEEIEPDMARTTPLCMNQYKYMFNSTRIPQIPSDVTRLSDPRQNQHIVVLRKNQFFFLDTVGPNGKRLSTNEIEAQLAKIYTMAEEKDVPPVGYLTLENRDTWTHLRNHLLALSPKNKASLDKIETAAFALCLDDAKPVTKDEASLLCWHGNGENRFFDKSMQFIVFDNAKAGFNGEHSMMDATPTSRVCEWVCEALDKGKVNHGESSGKPLAPPTRLDFDLDKKMVGAISQAKAKFNEVAAKHELKVVSYEKYGKNLIKKFKLSPDAYAQMAIQLAYYKMYGKVAPTYESAQTKKYAWGRTETCRSCTVESTEWVKAMEDPLIPAKVKGELGRKAVQSQVAYMAKAVEGKGCDRHLLGLRLLIKPDEPIPAIFTDKAYAATCHWNLSTSQVTSEYYDGYGWGEVVADGYGIAYMVKEESLQFNLVSQHLRNEHLRHFFVEALNDMKVVFEAALADVAPKAKL